MLQATKRNSTGNSQANNLNITLSSIVSGNASIRALSDFYLVGLWSYCEGDLVGGIETIRHCSLPTTQFWFDAADVWGLENASLQSRLGVNLKRIAGWMDWAFIVTTVLAVSAFVVGFRAMSHRGSSMLTILLSAVGLLNTLNWATSTDCT